MVRPSLESSYPNVPRMTPPWSRATSNNYEHGGPVQSSLSSPICRSSASSLVSSRKLVGSSEAENEAALRRFDSVWCSSHDRASQPRRRVAATKIFQPSSPQPSSPRPGSRPSEANYLRSSSQLSATTTNTSNDNYTHALRAMDLWRGNESQLAVVKLPMPGPTGFHSPTTGQSVIVLPNDWYAAALRILPADQR